MSSSRDGRGGADGLVFPKEIIVESIDCIGEINPKYEAVSGMFDVWGDHVIKHGVPYIFTFDTKNQSVIVRQQHPTMTIDLNSPNVATTVTDLAKNSEEPK